MLKTTLDRLLEKLPHNYKKATGNLRKIVDIFVNEINEVEENYEELKKQKKLSEATGRNLDRHGNLVQQNRGRLNDEIYRALIRSKIRTNLSPGDVNSIIEYVATILDTEPENINIHESEWGSFRFSSQETESEYNELESFGFGTLTSTQTEPAFFEFSVPPGVVNDIMFPIQNLVDIVDSMTGAGVRVGFYVQGAFGFSDNLTAPEYNSEFGFDNGTLGAYYNPSEKIELPS